MVPPVKMSATLGKLAMKKSFLAYDFNCNNLSFYLSDAFKFKLISAVSQEFKTFQPFKLVPKVPVVPIVLDSHFRD